jgi:2-polyprenyl-3-methyl-5-hydroxy-6-metoxy-1,4-benzoquinol methylase
MAHRSTRTTQYHYFNTQFEGFDWTNKKILDFGGNIGGFLSGAPDNINQKNYWCIDVDKGAIEIGQKRFPLAHFNWFNRYSSYDNPTGVAGLKIPFESERFDIIISFSVFTHVSKVDMIDLLGQLKALLNPGGILFYFFRHLL